MQGAEKLNPEQIRVLLEASQELQFHGEGREEVYEWITRTLRQQHYRDQGRKNRGLLKSYVEKMTGLSRSQVTRLFASYREHSEVKAANYIRRSFPSRFTRNALSTLAPGDWSCLQVWTRRTRR